MASARTGQPQTRREPFGVPALLTSGCLLAALLAPVDRVRAVETAAQRPQSSGGGGRSGLAWNSGATTGGFPCLAQLRGRPLDARTIFITHASFPAMVKNTSVAAGSAKDAPVWVVSLPLLPSTNRVQFSQCAGGAFDSY